MFPTTRAKVRVLLLTYNLFSPYISQYLQIISSAHQADQIKWPPPTPVRTQVVAAAVMFCKHGAYDNEALGGVTCTLSVTDAGRSFVFRRDDYIHSLSNLVTSGRMSVHSQTYISMLDLWRAVSHLIQIETNYNRSSRLSQIVGYVSKMKFQIKTIVFNGVLSNRCQSLV